MIFGFLRVASASPRLRVEITASLNHYPAFLQQFAANLFLQAVSALISPPNLCVSAPLRRKVPHRDERGRRGVSPDRQLNLRHSGPGLRRNAKVETVNVHFPG